MGELGRGERLQIMLAEDELRAVDDWRFKTRMPSRAAAIRELLRRGLAASGFDSASVATKSKEFGVIGSNGARTGNVTHNGNGNDALDGNGTRGEQPERRR
jgi:hypothetical protein